MSARFDSFVILGEMRTGSNLLESLLQTIPDVTCHGEAFNRTHLGGPGRDRLLGIDILTRDRDPMLLLDRIRSGPGLNGFRLFHDHDLRVLDPVLQDRGCAKIVLGRNPVDSWVSLQIARQTQNWRLTDIRRRKTATVTFDAAAFDAFLAERAAFRARIQRALQTSGQTAFFLDYDDLREPGILSGLAAWLGRPGALDPKGTPMLVQNPEPLSEKVENWDQMQAELAKIDYFGLSTLPNFEPRRGAAVGSYVAARGVPLLWLPLGPEPRITSWLAALGRGGPPETGFTHKSLAEWKLAHPGFRSFALVRHPLDRADRALRGAILPGKYPRIRNLLIRDFGLNLPDPEAVPGMGAAAYRAALLGFLRFLKLNLNGQTAIRVDRFWCGQAHALAAMAGTVLPDMIVRADRMQAALDHLADSVGAAPVPVPAEEPAGPVPLAEICDDALQQAAAAAYPRDMAAFGFGAWAG